jgi:hypothetical protein
MQRLCLLLQLLFNMTAMPCLVLLLQGEPALMHTPTRVPAGATHSATTTAAASAPTLERVNALTERAAAMHTLSSSELS